jgi:hypothetical protein
MWTPDQLFIIIPAVVAALVPTAIFIWKVLSSETTVNSSSSPGPAPAPVSKDQPYTASMLNELTNAVNSISGPVNSSPAECTCPQCQKKNPGWAKFCRRCGLNLASLMNLEVRYDKDALPYLSYSIGGGKYEMRYPRSHS